MECFKNGLTIAFHNTESSFLICTFEFPFDEHCCNASLDDHASILVPPYADWISPKM